MSTFRGFIAIDVDTFPKIIEFENDIKSCGANVKLVEPKNIHITLRFLGDTEESLTKEIEMILKDTVKDVVPFNIQLKSAGVFPNSNYIKVIWIGIKQGQLLGTISHTLNKQISTLGFHKEERKFSPHLTIARVKTAKNKERLLQIIEKYTDVEFGVIRVNTIKLKKSVLTSQGPIYTTLKEVNF